MILPTRPGAASLTITLVFLALLYYVFLSFHTSPQTINTVVDAPYGTLQPLTRHSRFAIVTLLGDDTLHEREDNYFVASRMLTHQFVHQESTRIRPENRRRIDWIVAVTPGVETWKREQLRRDGAKVIEVTSPPLPEWIRTSEKRWKDQFAKLELLKLGQYSRVLYIDADGLVLHPLDGAFDTPQARNPARTNMTLAVDDEGPWPAEYVFLASEDHSWLGQRTHPAPPDPNRSTGSFSGGFWMVAPSLPMYEHLHAIMDIEGRFGSPHSMEQSLLNYAHRHCDGTEKSRRGSVDCPAHIPRGPMPWSNVGWEWSSTWPSVRDVMAGVSSLHEKLWRVGPEPLQLLWFDARRRMEADLGEISPNLMRAEGK